MRPTTAAPNDLWTADFKGEFRTGNGWYCYPLTIADQHTRFLLACRGLLSTKTVTAKPVFERVFREYGPPVAIRTDNGVPFATQAIHALSYLNVWWMQLAIGHQRIHPGVRRRMVRTSAYIARSSARPSNRCAGTARRSNATLMRSNASTTPSDRMSDSTKKRQPRSTTRRRDPIRIVCRLRNTRGTSLSKRSQPGTFRFRDRLLYLANTMVDQHMGLEETDDGIWTIHFNTVLLAERDYRITG
ncbi:MAG: DDE-type integrase/transposase/recombinase [Gemmatimonadaceae bacterium]|nr:DDE-type integrase/transposase/recombinase [Gemmatimonadaceae bacterium]